MNANAGEVFPPLGKEIRLDRVRFEARARVSPEVLDRIEGSSYVDDLTHDLVLRLQAEVLEDKVAESTYRMTVPYPATPWHHFKHRHRDAWWMRAIVRHWPIGFTEKVGLVTLSKAHRFPKATIRYPDSLGPITMVEQGSLDYTVPA